MSNRIYITTHITDIDALDGIAVQCGMRLVRGSEPLSLNYKVRLNQERPCDHIMRLSNAKSDSLEIGVFELPNGTFELVYERCFHELEKAIGHNAWFLIQCELLAHIAFLEHKLKEKK